MFLGPSENINKAMLTLLDSIETIPSMVYNTEHQLLRKRWRRRFVHDWFLLLLYGLDLLLRKV